MNRGALPINRQFPVLVLVLRRRRAASLFLVVRRDRLPVVGALLLRLQPLGRPVEVVRVKEAEEAAVHLLYLRDASRSALRRIARHYQDGSVLTVADDFDFAALGGDVGIELVGDRISFSINRRKVARGDFVISSKLMRLASEVK